ncbi:NF-kappa-B inhibitor cactus-like isoform X2 [Eriocheir sinensis]|uniref:NF-kappa-B inhibitor cactus-like isoform X2 n=1 Tax=Eriocheir sinensis TaxID=95602 RepID=UPI0021C77245|nr:NF-kappa-B inhibitor cactus-like isoform X2 [Eriocheir sinensis]
MKLKKGRKPEKGEEGRGKEWREGEKNWRKEEREKMREERDGGGGGRGGGRGGGEKHDYHKYLHHHHHHLHPAPPHPSLPHLPHHFEGGVGCCGPPLPPPKYDSLSIISQLHVAVMRGFIEVVYHITRLLPHQALLDLANHQGKTALHLAVAAGDGGAARHLLVCGASPVERDRRGNTPLHLAAAAGQAALVGELTRPVTVAEVVGARLAYAPAHTAGLLAADLTNYDGQTCIHLAAQGGHRDILQHLTWYGADINAKDGKSGRTALHYAVEAREPGLVAFLAESCRVSLTLETYAGLTPYQLALANGATGIAELLLELGAPGEALPPYLTNDDDLDYDEVPVLPDNNGWGVMDDLRIGGVPVPLPLALPVTDASGPFNADRYL